MADLTKEFLVHQTQNTKSSSKSKIFLSLAGLVEIENSHLDFQDP